MRGLSGSSFGVLVISALFVSPAEAQQSSAPAPAVFGGTVRDAVTGQALGRALVLLSSTENGEQYQATTDASGRFRFDALGANSYQIEASHGGYTDAHSAALKDGVAAASVVQLAAGDRITDAAITLQPEGAILGRVVEADGNPLENASVYAVREVWMRGRRMFDLAAAEVADTDGAYRLSLAPGRYYVQAAGPRGNGVTPATFVTEPGGPEMKTATVVYPNATAIEAGAALELAPGQQVTGIDFKLGPVACYHVRGTVPVGPRAGPSAIFLARRNAGVSMVFLTGGAAVKPDGSFDIAGIQPGHYILQSFPGDHSFVPTPVDVTDRDVNGVAPAPSGHFDVSGHVQFDGTGAGPALGLNLRMVDPAPSEVGSANAKADGSFTITHLAAGRFAVLAGGDAGLYVESLTVGGRTPADGLVDLTHGAVGALEVTLAKGTGEIHGRLRLPDAGSERTAIPEATAVLVSANGITANTAARGAALDRNGQFQFAPVPPGRWYVFAVPHYDEGLWQNMEFVRAVAGEGTAVQVEKSGSVQAEVSLLSMESVRRASEAVDR